MVSVWLTLLNSCIFGYQIIRNLTIVSLIFHVLLDLIHCALNVLSINILSYYGVNRSSHWYLLIELMSLCQLGCHSAISYMDYERFCLFVLFGEILLSKQIDIIDNRSLHWDAISLGFRHGKGCRFWQQFVSIDM